MRIRVLTLNVWNSEGPAGRTRLINQAIKRIRPDLISFQEIVRSADEGQLAQLTEGLDFATTHQADMQTYAPPFSDRTVRVAPRR